MQDVYKNRRKELLSNLKKSYPETKRGMFILCAGIEDERYRFVQDSNFYYFTGINEPGTVLTVDFDGREILFLPSYGKNRDQWIEKDEQLSRFENIESLGDACSGYTLMLDFVSNEYLTITDIIKSYLSSDGLVFVLTKPYRSDTFITSYRGEKILDTVGLSKDQRKDITNLVHRMRRKKDAHEIELIQRATDVTCAAHRAVARSIKLGIHENEIQGIVVNEFFKNGAQGEAFPSIVATGHNATVLHYTKCNQEVKDGDMVVVDIGAIAGRYCADLTRTYPANGKFSSRQSEIYELVLAVQTHIASLAKPGMYLINTDDQKKSLHHLTVQFFAEHKMEKYFVHGVGHFLGLDVHDVGDMRVQLQEGDVFTIEPGLYIPEESLGVRIEDDYVMTKDGVRCFSEKLEK